MNFKYTHELIAFSEESVTELEHINSLLKQMVNEFVPEKKVTLSRLIYDHLYNLYQSNLDLYALEESINGPGSKRAIALKKSLENLAVSMNKFKTN